MTSRARYKALEWFEAHERLGPDALLMKEPPTRRMTRLMEREGQIRQHHLGHFGYKNWTLTAMGRAVLGKKPGKKKMGNGSKLTPERLAYSVREAAKVCGMSKSTLYRQAEAGKLRLTRVGKRTIVTKEELLRFLEEANEQQ